nr:MAG: RNA-dependent RNA polymerase [Permutotetraviridae sp.]
MDASNPVSSGDRVTFADLKEDSLLLKRQNYEKLNELIGTSPRTPVSYIGRSDYEYDPDLVKHLLKPIPVEKGKVETGFLRPAEKVRVCKYHTMGENQKEGYVSMTQTYKVAQRDKQLIEVCLRSGVTSEDISRLIYTTGDKIGFSQRLKLWSTKRVPNPKSEMEKLSVTFKDVRKLLPVNVDGLPNWNGDMDAFLAKVTVNKSSGAGPPFYRSKRFCLDECFDVVSELVKEANQDHVAQFLRENEEFLVGQCKNKTDRYPPEKLAEKTRPYFSFSFPVQFLCSALNQPFTQNMLLFTERGCNACGFSYANGGGQALFDWMKKTKENEVKCCMYGDDWKLVWRKGGVLYSNSPDFQCMDGSVHKRVAEEYVDYVLACFEEKWGSNNFWKFIGEVWKKQLVGAKFYVDGPQPYQNDTGLLTGCVGTTGVDTFLSVLAFACLIEKRHHGLDLMNTEDVGAFLLSSFGLKLKGTTYEWSIVQEELDEGEQPNTQEFLGVQLKMVRGGRTLEAIPYKEESDLISLISNARVPEELRDKKTTGRGRYLFDCARGYMITAAFLHEKTWNICCRLIENTKTEIICMRVQTGKKVNGEYVGESPELEALTGEDFAWPSSDGWPSIDFCVDVYLSNENKRGGAWIDCVPALREKLDQVRKYRSMNSAIRVPAVVFRQDTGDWSVDMETYESNVSVGLKVDRKVDPQIDQKGYVREFLGEKTPLMKPAKLPKEFVKYSKQVQAVPKETRIKEAVPAGAEQFHRELIPLVTNLAPGKCAEILISLGWRPSPSSSYWEKGELVAVDPRYWTRAELDHLPSQSRGEKPRAKAPKEVQKGETWAELPADVVLSDRDVDVVSKVSYSFVNAGHILKVENEVLGMSPNPWIKAKVSYRGTGVTVGEGYGTNKNAAKIAVFELLLKKLEAREKEPKINFLKLNTKDDKDRETTREATREKAETEREKEDEERDHSGNAQTTGAEEEERRD